LLLSLALVPAHVRAWGADGHTIINRLAAQTLPASLPAFLRTPIAIEEIAYLGPEEDRIKGAGESWDGDTDEGHFLDLDDDDMVAGVVAMDALPSTMSEYARALLAAKTTPYKQGYLPYAILDGFERVRKDFALWRVADFFEQYAAQFGATTATKSEWTTKREIREAVLLHDIGVWGHYVGDASQPLHISIHYNGWGEYPNPNGYATSHHIHAMFESEFVATHVGLEDVRPHLGAYTAEKPDRLLTQQQLAARVGAMLLESAKAVRPLYEIEKRHGFDRATPEAVTFTASQLARGASTLRDLIALAWEDSLNQKVGYPGVRMRDVLDGKVPASATIDE